MNRYTSAYVYIYAWTVAYAGICSWRLTNVIYFTLERSTMESIPTLVKDPGWWFTAVVVGLLVSVAAGFAQNYLSLIGSKLSSSLAKRREAQVQKRKKSFERC